MADEPQTIIRIEYFHDEDPQQPSAAARFRNRVHDYGADLHAWATIAIESVTFMELSYRKEQQYLLNPTAKDPRQWYAGTTDGIEEMLAMRMAGLRTNVWVAAHIDQDKDEVGGFFVRTPAAPGRLRTRLPAGFGELYRTYRHPETHLFLLQTQPGPLFGASTQIGTPDGCENDGAAVASQLAEGEFAHGLIYGETGTRKSTFISNWPKPMLVFQFDPLGKDTPYLRQGTPGPLQTEEIDRGLVGGKPVVETLVWREVTA